MHFVFFRRPEYNSAIDSLILKGKLKDEQFIWAGKPI